MAKKLFEKAGLINLPPAAPRQAVPADVDAAGKAKTAPGSMMQFMTAQSAAIKEAESLRERLASFEGALPARLLDPKRVRVSPWANRHQASYQDEAFSSLKSEIGSAGGNVQPIKVRPVRGGREGVGRSNPPALDVSAEFEIVYGHRRHRACLELGLPVLAVVEDLSEQQLFEQMERENRARKDLSAWEQGAMYARAIDSGLYPSNRQLALAIGRDLGDVGKALALARLPAVVVEAFKSPLDLQYRWAKPLGDAQQRDPDGLLARAKALKASSHELSPRGVFEALVAPSDGGVGRSNPPPDITVQGKEGRKATVCTDTKGMTTIRMDGALDEARRRELARVIEQFLSAED